MPVRTARCSRSGPKSSTLSIDIISANLTPGNPTGIAAWSNQQVKDAITKGVRPDRPLVRLMAFDWYQNMSNADLNDLVAFLRSLKPVKTQ